jgi:hypothetical protein
MYIAVAKFYVSSVQKFGAPNYQTGTPETTGIKVELYPVPYKPDDPTHENSKFWTASPSGKMELQIQNKSLFDAFEVGTEIYLPMVGASGVTLEELSGTLHTLLDNR